VRIATGNYGVISLSPDGRLIATPFFKTDTDQASVFIVPVDGGTPREIWRLEPGQWINNAAMAWTPDSRSVLVHRMLNADATESELWIVPVSGGSPRKLGFDATQVAAYQPGKIRLHPDGKQLAYQSRGESTTAVWVIENFLPAEARDETSSRAF
jgi:Tol biopolymer transport system component